MLQGFLPPLRQGEIASLKKSRYGDELSNLSDDKLIEIYKTGEQILGAGKLNYIENARGIERIMVAHQPDEFYGWLAVVDVLGERHGEDFVEKLTGVPKPKTFWEKLKKAYYDRSSKGIFKLGSMAEHPLPR